MNTKLCLITGASRGLGAAMAPLLAAKGYHILAVARTTGALEELDDRIRKVGGTATLAPMDVTNPDAMTQLTQSALERWGGVDLWVHTAIFATSMTPAGHIDQKDWRRAMDTNIEATRGLITLLDPLLRARDGRAVFFDDARAGEAYFGCYGATKAAQIALARSWQAEGARLGPRVDIARPAPMPTALRGRFFPGEDRASLTPCADEAARLMSELDL